MNDWAATREAVNLRATRFSERPGLTLAVSCALLRVPPARLVHGVESWLDGELQTPFAALLRTSRA